MITINCSACGFTNAVPEGVGDPELEEARAEVRRLQAARVGFALVSRETLRAMFDGVVDREFADALIDKALGPNAFAS